MSEGRGSLSSAERLDLDDLQAKAEMIMLTDSPDPALKAVGEHVVQPMARDILRVIAELRDARSALTEIAQSEGFLTGEGAAKIARRALS